MKITIIYDYRRSGTLFGTRTEVDSPMDESEWRAHYAYNESAKEAFARQYVPDAEKIRSVRPSNWG